MRTGHPWLDGSGDGWAGKADAIFRPSNNHSLVTLETAPEWMRTCPQYYSYSPFVIGILDDLGDYEANRLGNVFELPWPYLVYLRAASQEQKAWYDWWMAEMHARSTKK